MPTKYTPEMEEQITAITVEIVQYMDTLLSEYKDISVIIPLKHTTNYLVMQKITDLTVYKLYLKETNTRESFTLDLKGNKVVKESVKVGAYKNRHYSLSEEPPYDYFQTVYSHIIQIWNQSTDDYPLGLKKEIERVLKMKFNTSHLENMLVDNDMEILRNKLLER